MGVHNSILSNLTPPKNVEWIKRDPGNDSCEFNPSLATRRRLTASPARTSKNPQPQLTCDSKAPPLGKDSLFLFLINLFILRERKKASGEGVERIPSRFQVPSCRHGARRGARTHGPRQPDLSRSRTLNRLSQPGVPEVSLVISE